MTKTLKGIGISGYPDSDTRGNLRDFKGNIIGKVEATGSRPAIFFGKRSFIGDKLISYRVTTPDGLTYFGRGFGKGMSLNARLSAKDKRKQNPKRSKIKYQYFKDYDAARLVLEDIKRFHPAARIVEYEKGYAIQFYLSGTYYTAENEAKRRAGKSDWHVDDWRRKPGKKNPVKKYKRQLSVPEKHQLKIARQTLNMPDAMVGVMGGPNKEQAREIIKRLTGKTMKENPRAFFGKGDKAAAHELYLFAINDAELYRQRIEPVIKNLLKKIKRKVYDHKLALKLWKYVADDAAKRYTHGGYGRGPGYGIFTVPIRLETAKELQIYYDEQLEEKFTNPKSRSRKTARAFDARSIRNVSKGGKKTRKKNPARYYYYIFRKHKGIRYYLTVSDVPYKFDSIKNLARYFVDKKDAVSLAEKIATQFNIRLFVGS